jgi:hypothetical protein
VSKPKYEPSKDEIDKDAEYFIAFAVRIVLGTEMAGQNWLDLLDAIVPVGCRNGCIMCNLFFEE